MLSVFQSIAELQTAAKEGIIHKEETPKNYNKANSKRHLPACGFVCNVSLLLTPYVAAR